MLVLALFLIFFSLVDFCKASSYQTGQSWPFRTYSARKPTRKITTSHGVMSRLASRLCRKSRKFLYGDYRVRKRRHLGAPTKVACRSCWEMANDMTQMAELAACLSGSATIRRG